MRCHAKYDHRLQEWYYALAATSYGMGLLHPQTSMASSAYSRLLSWGSENVWGGAFLAAGVVYLVALTINGARWWTPFLRAAMAATITLAFAALAVGFAAHNAYSTAVLTYGFILPLGGLFCAYPAVKDCVHGWEVWKCLSLSNTQRR